MEYHWVNEITLQEICFAVSLSPLSFLEQTMMTSSNGNIFRVTGPLCGEFTGPGEFPAQRPVTRSFDVFFDLRPNKRLSKQPWGWWFETLSWSLWRHRNADVALVCLCFGGGKVGGIYLGFKPQMMLNQIALKADFRHSFAKFYHQINKI